MTDNESAEAGTSSPLSAPSGVGGPRTPADVEESTQGAFGAFYRSFMPKLVGFLMYQGAQGQLAADLAQETMITAHRKWREIRAPEAWTRRVASRALVRHLSRVEEDLVDEVPDGVSVLLPRPDELAELEGRHVFLEVMRALPPRQRQVLAWTVSGYSPSEIAEELQIKPDAVRGNLQKARRAAARRINAVEEDA
ncbi:RNA polymerase sigma factor [Kitasatospora sp. NPDC048365]|uniref:RNA polymerase sigma factor n=1 Tax=Kitasatospora sp. NPDC048365 TaxID=3364050 RepID=UPI00371F0B9A